MLHSSVAQHAVSCLGPRTIHASAVGKFMERLPKVLWAGISPLDLALLTALTCDWCDPTECCQSVRVFPAILLRTKCAEQSWRESLTGTAQTSEEVRVGMSPHDLGDLCIKLFDRLADVLKLIGRELDSHRRRCDQSIIATEQLGGTDAKDDFILLLRVTDGVFTQNAAN
jgi:hypothetical protein